VAWDELDQISPQEFTLHTAPRLLENRPAWAELLPAPQVVSRSLIEEGHVIPVARVQAMHEGRRRARDRQ